MLVCGMGHVFGTGSNVVSCKDQFTFLIHWFKLLDRKFECVWGVYVHVWGGGGGGMCLCPTKVKYFQPQTLNKENL